MVEIESVPELWAGSIEVAVTCHDPEDTIVPPTMTSMPSGRWMLSGRTVIVNGQKAKRGYSSINLEEGCPIESNQFKTKLIDRKENEKDAI